MTGLERLEVLADFLESDAVPEDRFDMNNWRRELPCGSVCCAVGWVSECPALADEGLVMRPGTYGLTPVYYALVEYEAAAAFFKTTFNEAKYLFSPLSYDEPDWTPKAAVVARIREFIRERKESANA